VSAISITDGTTYAGKDPGQTLNFSFSSSGSVGTPVWNVGVLDENVAEIDSGSSGTGTGATFNFDALALSPGSGRFLVQVQDPETGQYNSLIVTLTVTYPANEVFTSADDLDDSHAFQVSECNAAGGAFNITVNVDPAGRGKSWWGVKNSGASNNVTVKVPTGKKLNGVVNGTQVLTPGQSAFVFANGRDGFVVAGGP
jgi:hypothetical protein